MTAHHDKQQITTYPLFCLRLVAQGFEIGSSAAKEEGDGKKQRASHAAKTTKTKDGLSRTVSAMDIKYIKVSRPPPPPPPPPLSP